MDIAELLNPAVESRNLSDTTDEYIFNSMAVAKKLLQAALTLGKHVATLNVPFSLELEVMVGSFGQRIAWSRLHGMTDTNLTDYFVRK